MDKRIDIGMKIGMKIGMEIVMGIGMETRIEMGIEMVIEIGVEIATGIVAVDGMVLVENSLLTAVEREDAVDSTHAMMTLAMMIVAASVQQ